MGKALRAHRDAPAALPVRSFPPIDPPQARVLILGSVPGQASLQAQRYYAHPQNAFWRVMAAVLGFDTSADYAQRIIAVRAARVAVWDVIDQCVRPGSLDASIDRASVVTNDFASWFARHPELRAVAFNGGAAATLFQRHVTSRIALPVGARWVRLPSTSPANASMPFDAKLALWRAFLDQSLNDH